MLPAATATSPAPALDAELGAIVGPRRISRSEADRTAYARDLWPRTLLAVRDGVAAPTPPDVVVWPETTEEVARIVRVAAARRIPLVPFGAGSGVCGAATTPHGGILLDLKRMAALVDLDEAALTATFETGILGEHLERALGARGYTLGHFPSSIYCSTLGGWLAARSAGQCSTRYGKIEDMVLGLTVVTGTGEILETGTGPRVAPGPDWTQALVGSEGTLGVITRGRLRIEPAPEVRILRGISFPRVSAGCEAIRRLLQRGLRPAVVRLYDELDTLMALRGGDDHAHDGTTLLARLVEALPEALRTAGPSLKKHLLQAALERPRALNSLAETLLPHALGASSLLIVGFEGPRALAEAEARAGLEELRKAGGRDLGDAPGRSWFENRYRISYRQSTMFASGAWVDTMEVAATWDRLLDVYHAVRRAVAPHAFVMAHFSHGYPDGCSIYFTFAGSGAGSRQEAERGYDATWRAGLSAALRAGATLSHHHGVGRAKAAFLPEEQREGMHVLHALKAVLDPHGILNPGNLGLGVRPAAPAAPARAAAPSSLDALAHRLSEALGAAHVGATDRDLTDIGLAPSPDLLIVRPGSAAEVAEAVRSCLDAGARIVPVGRRAPRSVRGAARGAAAAGGPLLLCDTRRMTNVLHLDETSLTVHVQSGLTAGALEGLLAPRGLTLGDHLPADADRTIGELLAVRRPGRPTLRCGWLEDACLAVSAVLADGRVVHTRAAPRHATGPDVARVLLGGQGALAILTAAVLRIHRRAGAHGLDGWELPGLDEAMRVVRALLRAGARPDVLRVVEAPAGDPLLPAGGALLLCALSGATELVEAQRAELKRAAAVAKGRTADRSTVEACERRAGPPGWAGAALEALIPHVHVAGVAADVRAALAGAGFGAPRIVLEGFTRELASARILLPPGEEGGGGRVVEVAGESLRRAGAWCSPWDPPAAQRTLNEALKRHLDPAGVLPAWRAEGSA